jgi:hypothetical protein
MVISSAIVVNGSFISVSCAFRFLTSSVSLPLAER